MGQAKQSHLHSLPTDLTVDYPESDGKPMAETDMHRDLMVDVIKMLNAYFQDRSDVYVSGNLLLYYEEGNPKKCVAPDVFVVKGVDKGARRTYLLWKETKNPDFVLELSSRNTFRADLNQKKQLYAEILKVEEYFLYDPDHQYLTPPLQGYRRLNDTYVPISSVADRVPSTVLGLEFGVKPDGILGLYNPDTQSWLMTPEERVHWAEARADREAVRAERAEAELARLRTRLQQQPSEPNNNR